MPLVATRGAASAQGFGEFGAVAAPIYIEDVFSTYLYTGTSSEQTINNGIDLAGKGGLVWNKPRNLVSNHELFDTTRGLNNTLRTNVTDAQATRTGVVNAFNSNGFTAGTYFNTYNVATWTFRKQVKFFDVVTYTGNGVTGGRQIAHNLGSEPGCIIIKATSVGGTPAGWITPADWWVYHRGLPSPSNFSLRLNTTAAQNNSGGLVRTSTTFTVYGGDPASVIADNVNGVTYVAYLFAHNAGGFGLAGTDNVISCGSYNGTGSGTAVTVNLGYEPQWILIKNTTSATNWLVADVMRGAPVADTATSIASLTNWLNPNTTAAESAATGNIRITSTGFTIYNSELATNNDSQTYIYIAIRRGPMKVPTSGTSVFSPIASSSSQGTKQTSGFPVDLQIADHRNAVEACRVFDRLRGFSTVPTNGNAQRLVTNSTDAESADTSMNQYFDNTGFQTGSNYSGISSIFWNFRRAPGFFDVVAYTGTGVARTVNHNLAEVPELMIVKSRSISNSWPVYHAALTQPDVVWLDLTSAKAAVSSYFNSTNPTNSVFTVGGSSTTNGSGSTYIAYLFASCPGVSKVGSYTGTGALQTINCGFTSGARFVLIKRTDSTGDWYVYDSARGITSGNDPYLLLNSAAAEVTGTNYVDTATTGFQVTAAAPAGLNANGGTYIFLAIA